MLRDDAIDAAPQVRVQRFSAEQALEAPARFLKGRLVAEMTHAGQDQRAFELVQMRVGFFTLPTTGRGGLTEKTHGKMSELHA